MNTKRFLHFPASALLVALAFGAVGCREKAVPQAAKAAPAVPPAPMAATPAPKLAALTTPTPTPPKMPALSARPVISARAIEVAPAPNPPPEPTVVIVTEPKPVPVQFQSPVSKAGYKLILDFEVGGGQRYYDRFLRRIEWPGGASGPTGGVGYDFAYNFEDVIRHDWQGLREDWLDRLASECPGKTGAAGKAEAAKLRDILIEWGFGEKVFNEITIPRFLKLCRRTYPGFDDLRANAQASLLSLTFNRGESMAGPRRVQMRTIRGLAPKKDYAGMAKAERDMIPIWEGTDIYKGMKGRRLAEADLMETP